MMTRGLFWTIVLVLIIAVVVSGAGMSLTSRLGVPIITQELPINCLFDETCDTKVEVFAFRSNLQLPQEALYYAQYDEYAVSVWVAANNLHLKVEDTRSDSGPRSSETIAYDISDELFRIRYMTNQGTREERVVEDVIRLNRYIND